VVRARVSLGVLFVGASFVAAVWAGWRTLGASDAMREGFVALADMWGRAALGSEDSGDGVVSDALEREYEEAIARVSELSSRIEARWLIRFFGVHVCCYWLLWA
jgi:hypothetical protein